MQRLLAAELISAAHPALENVTQCMSSDIDAKRLLNRHEIEAAVERPFMEFGSAK
jgi:hypothetical protein